MVGCLWTSNVFQTDSHPQGIYMEPGVLEKTLVQEYRKALNIVYHPALTGYAILFVQQVNGGFILEDHPPYFVKFCLLNTPKPLLCPSLVFIVSYFIHWHSVVELQLCYKISSFHVLKNEFETLSLFVCVYVCVYLCVCVR